jgi:hypothetical protein
MGRISPLTGYAFDIKLLDEQIKSLVNYDSAQKNQDNKIVY